jgi:hypothetical protein
MTKTDYTLVDARIIELLGEKSLSFNVLQLDKQLNKVCTESGACNKLTDEWRVIDRRLQYLRKKGLIRSVRGKIGPEWELVR